MQKNKIIILLLIILFAVFTNLQFDSKEPPRVDIKNRIPLSVSGYLGQEIEVPERVFKLIKPEEIIMRRYTNGNKVIVMAAVVSENRDDLHAPEICYKLQGFQFNKEKNILISNGCEITGVNTLKDKKPYIFHFYYTDMKNVYTNRFEFLKNIMIEKMLNKPRKKYALITAYTDSPNEKDINIFSEQIIISILKGDTNKL